MNRADLDKLRDDFADNLMKSHRGITDSMDVYDAALKAWDARDRLDLVAPEVVAMRDALKRECCCPGETSWTTGDEILCDACEAVAAYDAERAGSGEK